MEGARPIPYSMVHNFLGQLNLTQQHPIVRYDSGDARNWRWTFSPSLSDRLGFPSQGGPLGYMAARMSCQIHHMVSSDATSQPHVSCARHMSSRHPQMSPSQKLGLQTPPWSPGNSASISNFLQDITALDCIELNGILFDPRVPGSFHLT